MKVHIVTVGEPKLDYAKSGWANYLGRLQRYHTVRVSHLADKWAYETDKIVEAAGNSYKVALVIDGPQLTSPELAQFLETRSLRGQELCFIVGGPEGLPQQVIDQANKQLGLSKLTFPHDLAMLILAEALYRASTITTNHPYHK